MEAHASAKIENCSIERQKLQIKKNVGTTSR